MNYKNLKNIVTSAAFAAGILFVNGCSDPSENAKNEEFPEVVATVPLKRDVALVDEYTARLAAVESVKVRARVKLADTNLKRAKELFAADVVSQEVLDTRNCEMLSANAALLSAKAVLRNA